MVNKTFDIDEILVSVDSLVGNKEYNNYNKKKIVENHEQFNNQKIDMTFNRDTEKIIVDAEKVQGEEIINNKYPEPLVLNNSKDEEKFEIRKNNLIPNSEIPLILLDEYNDEILENIKENSLVELKSDLLNEIRNLKNNNTEQNEIIKDLNILLDKFKNQERYSDLDKTIKLYQRDNAILRKKIFKLEDIETALRLKMTDVSHDKNNKKE
tara:strand:- start:111 stop:740 length:630 start_codon:yes stop_codon:yes gene_type:complete